MNHPTTPVLSGYSAQVIEENGRLALTFWPHCTKCKSPFHFDAEEPFAYCSCGTTEWGDPRPASWVCPPRQPLNEKVEMNDKTEQTVTDELPCPFCGSTEGFYVGEGITFRWRVISCRNCSEGTEVRHKNNSDEPDSYIADWNAAAPYPAMLRKEIDTLRTQLVEAQRDSEMLDLMIEQRAYVVSDPDCCDGYWLNYARPDGTVWTQATEHETPRAAIDAAKGESNG